jgi:lipopolysaccharide transport system ATP-binding protein
MEINRNRLERIIIENRFESLTGGRKAGVEDASSHERKGISGDWMNYFTPTIERKFLDRYGDLLIRADYC